MSSQIEYNSYIPLNSTFQFIERPLFDLNTELNQWMNKPNENRESFTWAIDRLKESLGEFNVGRTRSLLWDNRRVFLRKATEFLFIFRLMGKSMIICPAIIGLSPVTCVADIIIGIAEAIFTTYKERSCATARLILHAKCIASPIQHAVYLGFNSLGFLLIGFSPELASDSTISMKKRLAVMIMAGGACVGPPSYGLAQRIVGRELPEWCTPNGFNIFIEGGARDPFGRKFTEKAEKDYQNYKKSNDSERFSTEVNVEEQWRSYITSLYPKTQTNLADNDNQAKDEFEQFEDCCRKENVTMASVLGLSEAPTGADIKKAFIKLSMVVHPDKNPNRTVRAENAFKALTEARLLLEKKFNINQ